MASPIHEVCQRSKPTGQARYLERSGLPLLAWEHGTERVADHQAPQRGARGFEPPQANRPAPIMHDERHLLGIQCLPERQQASHMALKRVGGQLVWFVRTPEPQQVGGNHPLPYADQGPDDMPPQKRPGRIAVEQQHRMSGPGPLVDIAAAPLRRGKVARLVRPETVEGPIHLHFWVSHHYSTQTFLLAFDFLSLFPSALHSE